MIERIPGKPRLGAGVALHARKNMMIIIFRNKKMAHGGRDLHPSMRRAFTLRFVARQQRRRASASTARPSALSPNARASCGAHQGAGHGRRRAGPGIGRQETPHQIHQPAHPARAGLAQLRRLARHFGHQRRHRAAALAAAQMRFRQIGLDQRAQRLAPARAIVPSAASGARRHPARRARPPRPASRRATESARKPPWVSPLPS